MPRGHVLPDGNAVTALRGEAGLTQEELADRSGYGLRTIGKIESGCRTTAPTLTAIATVLTQRLGRRVELRDLLHNAARPLGHVPATRHLGSELVVGESICFLELPCLGSPDAAHTAEPNHAPAVLIDTLHIRQLPKDAGTVNFYYAAAGAFMTGNSLSHPPQPQQEQPGPAARPAATPPADCHVVQVNIPAAEDRQRAWVQNRVEYVDGGALHAQKFFDTHVVYPTEGLTLLVKFPRAQPYRTLRGLRRTPTGPLALTPVQPIDVAQGVLAYWRIQAPEPGESYQLCWT